jgi:hypothetical protein
MRHLGFSAMVLLGIAAGAPQLTVLPIDAAHAQGLGPSMNKGPNYDGTYAGVSVVNNSQGNTWTSGGSQPCVAEPAPTLTITHGRAEFPWQGYTLSGNVTPSGYMMLTSSFDQVFEGSINSQYQNHRPSDRVLYLRPDFSKTALNCVTANNKHRS